MNLQELRNSIASPCSTATHRRNTARRRRVLPIAAPSLLSVVIDNAAAFRIGGSAAALPDSSPLSGVGILRSKPGGSSGTVSLLYRIHCLKSTAFHKNLP